jgi:putative transposase
VKGLVERIFDIINDTFLRELPGYVLPLAQKMHPHDYDPVKNAVIGFRQLLWLFHHWLLTVYHVIPPASGLKMSINDRWREGLRLVPPAFLDRSADLDFLFGIVRPGTLTLDHRGVVYEGLYYYCEAADVLRYRDGQNCSRLSQTWERKRFRGLTLSRT